MVTESNKPAWWGVSKLEIVAPTSNSSFLYCNGRNRITLTIKVLPITKNYEIIGKEDLSDAEIIKHITLIDAIDESPLSFNDTLDVSSSQDKWCYTDNTDPNDKSNKFVKTPFGINHRNAENLLSKDNNNGSRLVSFNIYCKARAGNSSKKIAIKIEPPEGEVITSLSGPSMTGPSSITLTTLSPLEYRPDNLILHYHALEKAENACDADGSLYRVIELQLAYSDLKLISSEIHENQKTQDEIKTLNKLFYDNISEYPWIHRIAVLPNGAFSYYCWGFDHVPDDSGIDINSKNNPYNLGRGYSYCYVKVHEIFTERQEKFFILIIQQRKSGSGSSNPVTLDMGVKFRLYDQYGNKGDFKLIMSEDLYVENGVSCPGVRLLTTTILD